MTEKNNIIWITGAATGIGRALSSVFVKNGLNVFGSSRRETQLERFQRELNTEKGNFIYEQADISKLGDVNKVIKTIEKEYNIDCLVNNAGITAFKLVADTSSKEAEEIISANLIGAIHTTKAVLPGMIERNKGTIINILSAAATKIFTKSGVYAASKAGLLAFTNVLREELRGKNIRIINVIPGATKTPIWPNKVLEKSSDRMMSPEELANLIYDLYSIKSNMVVEEITVKPITGDL